MRIYSFQVIKTPKLSNKKYSDMPLNELKVIGNNVRHIQSVPHNITVGDKFEMSSLTPKRMLKIFDGIQIEFKVKYILDKRFFSNEINCKKS